MASKTPIIRQISWVSGIVQIPVLLVCIYIFVFLENDSPFLFGPLTYLILSYGLRFLISRYHQKGMILVKQGNFRDAIEYFEKSVDYFSKNVWVDKYRSLTMLSSSKMGYREMGLCNAAFCYSQTGDGLKAKEIYEEVLNDFPENVLATTALNIINSLPGKL